MKKILLALSCGLLISSTFAGWGLRDQFSEEEINQKKNEIRILIGHAKQAYPDQDALINALLNNCRMRSDSGMMRIVCEDLYNPNIPRNSAPTISEDSPFRKVQHEDIYTYSGAFSVGCIRENDDVMHPYESRNDNFVDEQYRCYYSYSRHPIGINIPRRICIASEKGSSDYKCATINSFLTY